MLLMSLAAWMYTITTALHRVRSLILDRERHTQWVRELVAPVPATAASSQASDPHRQSQP